ncbi:MAG: hypothetical protein JO232_00825 [Verrucomicrobia bacterium]|jgi:hypothetical protein|nr:hypothetical protein [Verrucomicrobiota bacterium]
MDGPVGWNQLVDALRNELQEKGGLIRLLDQQVQAVYRRDTRENERLEEQIRLQLRVIARSTQFRELILRQSASSFQMSEDVHVNELIASFPDFVRPLLEALVTEVDRLSNRLQDRLGQNDGLKQRFFMESTSGA